MEDKYAFLDPMDNEWKDVMDGMRKTEQLTSIKVPAVLSNAIPMRRSHIKTVTVIRRIIHIMVDWRKFSRKDRRKFLLT